MLSLNDFFKLQSKLNARVGLDDQHFALHFTDGNETHDPAALLKAGQWIDDMLKAMSSEIEELRDCTYWKHWCQEAQAGRRYQIKSVEAARKEVIDLFHFWISLAQILGMTPEMVSGMYATKLEANIKRQDDGYSIEIKDKAWQLFKAHPDDHPITMNYSGYPESLEDLPDEVAEYYLDWAKKSLLWTERL